MYLVDAFLGAICKCQVTLVTLCLLRRLSWMDAVTQLHSAFMWVSSSTHFLKDPFSIPVQDTCESSFSQPIPAIDLRYVTFIAYSSKSISLARRAQLSVRDEDDN